MKELDLHGKLHEEVELLVENFVLLNPPPVRIITGNSTKMQAIIFDVLKKHDFKYYGLHAT